MLLGVRRSSTSSSALRAGPTLRVRPAQRASSTWVGIEPWAPEPGKQHSAAVCEYVCRPPSVVSLAVKGDARRFPVRRVFCVGRNFSEHAEEMGADTREPPFFFSKPAESGASKRGAGDDAPSVKRLRHQYFRDRKLEIAASVF